MRLVPRLVAVLVLGMLLLGGAWDGAHSDIQRADVSSSQELDLLESLSVEIDAAAGQWEVGEQVGDLLPLLAGVCLMVALCCIVLAAGGVWLRLVGRARVQRVAAVRQPLLGRSTVPSLRIDQLSLSRT